MQINLPTDIERRLIERARQAGTTPDEFVLTVLRQQLGESPPSDTTSTLADFLADHIGVLGDEDDGPRVTRSSEQCGRRFGAGLLARHRRQDPA